MKMHKYVGLDVHSVSTVVAIAEGDRLGEVRLYGKVSSDLHALEKVLAKLGGENVVLGRPKRGQALTINIRCGWKEAQFDS